MQSTRPQSKYNTCSMHACPRSLLIGGVHAFTCGQACMRVTWHVSTWPYEADDERTALECTNERTDGPLIPLVLRNPGGSKSRGCPPNSVHAAFSVPASCPSPLCVHSCIIWWCRGCIRADSPKRLAPPSPAAAVILFPLLPPHLLQGDGAGVAAGWLPRPLPQPPSVCLPPPSTGRWCRGCSRMAISS